jgi:hypothetical protein
MNRQTPTTRGDPKSILDQRAGLLASRHEARLRAMTNQAVAQAGTSQKPGYRRFSAATAALALTVVIAATVILFKPGTEQPPQMATAEQLNIPDWVEDDTVPVSLLENMELYVWIARQSAAEIQG